MTEKARRWRASQFCVLWLACIGTTSVAQPEHLPRAMTERPAFAAEISALLQEFSWIEGTAPGEHGSRELASLGDELRRALTEQPRLQAQLASEQAARLRIDEARAERRPQLTMGLEHRNSLRDVDRNAFDQGSRVDAVASVSQLLFDFGASRQRVRSAQLGAVAEEWESRASAERILMEALHAYFDVLRYHTLVALAEDNVQQHQQIMKDVQERREAGAGSRADVLRAQSRIADARSQLVTLEGELAAARNMYQELFAAEPENMVLPALPVTVETTDAESVIDAAMRANSALNRSLKEVDASMASARAERNDRWPTVSLAFQGRQFDVDDRAASDTDLAVLVNLEFAAYTGGAASARVGQADARLQRARHERMALQRELQNQLRSAVTDAQARRLAWQAQTLAVDADREALEAYRAQFALGRRGLTDLLDARRDLFQSVRQLIDQRVDWDLARFHYLFVSGQLLSVLDIPVPAGRERS